MLATDLSARCDRALDRAAQIAKEWNADLIALNVLEVTASPDQVLAWTIGKGDDYALQIARKQLTRDLSGLNIHVVMRIVRSDDVAAAIRDVAISTDSALVITGVARNEIFSSCLLGSTVERLARTLSQPLLVVRNRAHKPYRRIVVATDFSDSSRHALRAAIRLFPGRELILYHAYQIPLIGNSDDLPHAGLSPDIEQGEYADFLAASKLPANVRVQPMIEYGTLETTLTQCVRNHEIDLVVMGTHGRSEVMSILLGSSAAKLLDWLPCDALVVRKPGTALA